MLFCYDPAANRDNWLHDTITQMIRDAFVALNAGRDPTGMPDCIPEGVRDKLEGRPKFERLFAALLRAAEALSTDQRNDTLSIMQSQNDIPAVFQAINRCATIDDLPEALQNPVKDLFEYAFGILTELGVRKSHYELIYNALPARVCPFCGLEHFDAPGAPQHDLDHYLPISRYPFAGCNLKNLAPMGDRCNSSYKLVQDILVADGGQKRRCFDPYGANVAVITLLQSRPFGLVDPRVPDWVIDLDEQPESVTWAEVWRIKDRYIRDVLTAEYRHWLEEFGRWWQRTGGPVNPPALIAELDAFIDSLSKHGFSDRAFLKRAVFEMLRRQLAIGPDAGRLFEFLRNVTRPDAIMAV